MTISFRTARLLLRPPEESDVAPLMAMDADPEVMRYIGAGAVIPPDRDRALRAVARWREQWDDQGYGMCSVLIAASGAYAGWVTLAVPAFLPEVLPAVEIGWRLRREHWGHGYATEAAAELLRFGLTEGGLDRLVSIRDVGNARSERVMDKLGLRLVTQTTMPATGQPLAVHAITRAELLPIRQRRAVPKEEVLATFATAPAISADELRADLDEVVSQELDEPYRGTGRPDRL